MLATAPALALVGCAGVRVECVCMVGAETHRCVPTLDDLRRAQGTDLVLDNGPDFLRRASRSSRHRAQAADAAAERELAAPRLAP